MNIIYAILVLGILGAVFGFVLAYASKIFAVSIDERQEAIQGVLPGANCGGCGFPGCSGYAAAVVEGRAATNLCVAGGAACAAKVAEIMGTDAGDVEKSVAFVQCCGINNTVKKYDYAGVSDCLSATMLPGKGSSECSFACFGLGTCVKACRFDAIHIVDNVAKVDREKCIGCLACISACPKGIIKKVPYAATITVPCFSLDKGPVVSKNCSVGCIGCKLCEKVCPFDAIKVTDNLAVIDYSKCTSCGACVQKCPRKLIKNLAPVVNDIITE